MRRSVRVCPFFLPLMFAAALAGESISEPGGGVTVSVDGTGRFTIASNRLGWTYGGSIPGSMLSITGPTTGSDNNAVSKNGQFDQLTIESLDPDGNPWRTELRAYHDLPTATISFSPRVKVPNKRPYAILNQFPITPHHFSESGWNRVFGLVGWMDTDSPWLFYDDDFNASILSAVSRPISERQVWTYDGTTYGSIALRIDASNRELPAGDVYTYLIAFDQGVGTTFRTWGSTLRNILGRRVTGNQSDLSMTIPMLSTDAGATYYYIFDPALGYEGTLQAAINSAKAVGIPIGVTHFDSWWYKKGGDCNAPGDPAYASWSNTQHGVWKFVVDPDLFKPIDLGNWGEGFVQRLGPGMAHGRWVDACSPYRLPKSDPSGTIRAASPVSGNVLIDLHRWEHIAHTLRQSGMVIFEQDFLSAEARAANTFDDEKFLNAMTKAMRDKGIDLQFCMPLGRHLLEAFRHENVHTVRVSGDRFGWNHWDSEMYGAIVVNAGSVWPTVDNFHTTERRNLLLAVLSAGPLALSDGIGRFVPINEAIRGDGLILKPDFSLVPTDASFVAEAGAVEQFYGVDGPRATNTSNTGVLIRPPLVAHTYSDFGSKAPGPGKVEYVFAYSRDQNTAAPISIRPEDYGFQNAVYVYDYFGKSGWWQPGTLAFATSVDSQGSYYVMAPIGASGMAFVGDVTKFVPASRQRVMSLSDDGQITAALAFKSGGETVPISIFATAAPVVSADQATVSTPVYDSATGLYRVMVTSESAAATLHIAAGR